MEYTKGDKVLFGNEYSLKEGTVIAIDQSYCNDSGLLLIDDSIGNSFFRRTSDVLPLHLTKAAPAMCEALKVAETCIYNEIGHHPEPSDYRRILQNELRIIAQALAKAEGK